MEIEATLSKLQSLLYGYNYEVFLRCYRVPFTPGATIEEYIVQALPNAEIGGIQSVSSQDVLIEVEQSLRYSGDNGHGPGSIDSPRFEALLETVLVHVQQIATDATTIASFWLKHGHPAYPVFWDFAFIFVGIRGRPLMVSPFAH